MKNYGKIESYDGNAGTGLLKPDTGGEGLTFHRSAFQWTDKAAPPVGQRISYELSEKDGVSNAIKLQHA